MSTAQTARFLALLVLIAFTCLSLVALDVLAAGSARLLWG